MKIIEPSFEVMPVNGEEILKSIERAGRPAGTGGISRDEV